MSLAENLSANNRANPFSSLNPAKEESRPITEPHEAIHNLRKMNLIPFLLDPLSAQ